MSFLDELYYGNINPNENRNRKKLSYEKALSRDIPPIDNILFILARKLILEIK